MRKHLCAAAALLACSAGPALATTVLAQDIDALSRSADAVIQGRVKRVESRWTSDRARIVTDVEIEVIDALKGSPGKTVTVIQPGGVVGDVGQRVSGLASFEAGEEVVVFLEQRPGDTFLVAGMAQGKLRVERSSDGKAAFAVPEASIDALLLDPVTRQPVPPKVQSMKLDELKARVRAAVPRPAPGVEKRTP